MAARRYHALRDDRGRPASQQQQQELSEAEEELLALLKARGVGGICASISKEIHYVWAVASGFRTLSNAGNFYFACGARAFGYNPARDFFAAHGLQLALFAIRKFVHNEHVLVPALDCVAVFCRLDVEGALEFLAVADAAEIVMKCVRFHDNKHDVISAACQALGSLVLNDMVKDALSTPELVRELLGLVRRYGAVQSICRAAIAPLGFLVTDAAMTAAFVDTNGIALTMAAMKTFLSDAELVWHVIGLLNGLNAKALDPLAIVAIHGGTGIPRVVEALATHLDTEEIAVEGFQLLARLADHAPAAINASRVLDLALLALFAYAGQQHRHTRREIKAALPSFHKCALQDPAELARRERVGGASRATFVMLAALAACLVLATLFSSYDTEAADVVRSVKRLVERDTAWWSSSSSLSVNSSSDAGSARLRALRDVKTADDVWNYLSGPLHEALFAPDASQTDNMAVVDRAHVLLGGVQLRRIRVRGVPCPPFVDSDNSSVVGGGECFPPYSYSADATSAGTRPHDVVGSFAVYSGSAGDRQFFPATHSPVVSSSTSSSTTDCETALCRLNALRGSQWLDPRSSRALIVNFNLYTPSVDVHCRVQLLFEFAATGGAVLASRAHVSPLRLRSYRAPVTSWAPTVATELALLGCIAWFAAAQVAKLVRYRWLYFIIRHHVLDATIVALGVAAIAIRAQSLAASSFTLRRRLALSSTITNSGYVELDELEHLVRTEREVIACFGVLVWWRVVRVACRSLRALESAFDKVAATQSSSYLEALGWLLALAVVCAAHPAVVMTGSSGGGDIDDGYQRGLGGAILRMASAAVQRWRREDTLRGRSPFGDASASVPEPSTAPVEVVRVALELASIFVMLGIVAAILRDRFDSSASRLSKSESLRYVDELRLLELAKEKLEAHGMRVQETSLTKKLRAAASAGLEKLQSAVLAKADDSLELLDLRRAWGLSVPGDDSSQTATSECDPEAPTAATVLLAAKHNKLAPVPTTRLYTAEQRERELEQRLSEMVLRVRDVAKHLGQFQQVVQEEMLAADVMGTVASLTGGVEGTAESLRDPDLPAIDRAEADAAGLATVDA